MSERLQKLLARVGLGSRRQIEDWIRQGRITVNGVPAQLGVLVNGAEKIHIDGKLTPLRPFGQQRRVLAYYKPVGEVTTRSDPEGRPTIFERLPPIKDGRWIAVGRLDYTTQGLLLVTNDGELANRLTHPRFEVEKTYRVKLKKPVTPEAIDQLQRGVRLDDGMTAPATVKKLGEAELDVTIHEGRNRQVRRMAEAIGNEVVALQRISLGSLKLGRLGIGKCRLLDEREVERLWKDAGDD